MCIAIKEVVHIIGIGGIGMSAIAELLYSLDYTVQGSDIHSNDNTDRLKSLGIKVHIGHSAGNIEQANTIVYSSAIKHSNLELIAARNSNKIILHRSDILSELAKDKYTIAVSGSSGKTTTAAIIASIFDHSDIDATIIAGGIVNSYRSNAKLGKGDIFLIEADESDGTMLKIPANIAVITSLNDDHIDYYGTFDNIKSAFCKFINKANFSVLPYCISQRFGQQIPYDGVLHESIKHDAHEYMDSSIACWNNKEPSITFGFECGNVKAIDIKQYSNNIQFSILVHCRDKEYTINDLVLSNAVGQHKVSNALAAISVAIKLGISNEYIRKGLLEFKGVARRFSLIADVNGIKLIEDYAHHPTEIRATLTAARSITDGKIIGIIELLRFARIRNFFDEFIKVFMNFDYVVLTDVHPSEDKPISGYDLSDIQQALINNGFYNVKIINDPLLISRLIINLTHMGDIVLFIGAGSNIARLARASLVSIYSKIK